MEEGPLELGSWVIPYKTLPCGHYQQFSSYPISPLPFLLQSQALSASALGSLALTSWSHPPCSCSPGSIMKHGQMASQSCWTTPTRCLPLHMILRHFRSLPHPFYPARHLWDYTPPFPVILLIQKVWAHMFHSDIDKVRHGHIDADNLARHTHVILPSHIVFLHLKTWTQLRMQWHAHTQVAGTQ